MIYGSVCSGIEAASVAWESLGWKAAWFSEIEPFPCAVLQHHYPEVPNLGDMTTLHKKEIFNDTAIDVLIGGTPCQSFSVAGLRKGMADPRGNLALIFLSLVDRKRPSWVVWENVPGVLSSSGGRDFGAFLGGLAELGYGFAYRVLDAQFFGIPQRRRRVFVVGYLGDWRPAAAVLFERHSLSGDTPPSRKKGERVAPSVTSGPPFSRTGNERVEAEYYESHPADSRIEGPKDIADTVSARYGTGGGNTPLIMAHGQGNAEQALRAGAEHNYQFLRNGSTVRRLTPRECERLQGFPDDYTLISFRGKPACDGPRYKALGNSMAVPVISWIGERIEAVKNEL